MIPTLARGALFLGDAVATSGRGLVSGPLGSSNPPHRPICDGGSGSKSGGNNGSAAAATTSATTALPKSSLHAVRTSSRFNFSRPSFEVSRRASIEASAQSTKTFVRRPIDLAPLEDEFAAASLHRQEQQQQQPAADAASPSTSASSSSPSSPKLPAFLTNLLDPSASVDLPPGPAAAALRLDNRELDKLVAALGRSRATWRRALMLHEWLLAAGHSMDGRLATTLLRAASQHGAAVTALGLYDWMRAPVEEGGAALQPTVFTYTAAMRAALAGGLLDRALQVWDDAAAAGCAPDCRMATALVEVSARRGDTDRALAAYSAMRDAPRGSRLSPSVHAFTAAMRAAAEGGRPEAALAIWDDLEAARPAVRPTGHAFAAAISACAGAGDWRRAVRLFEAMLSQGIKPDVVSCTALVAALGGGGRADDAAAAVKWMLAAGVRPNVRTYTALLSAQAGARRWDLALDTLARMKGSSSSSSASSAFSKSRLAAVAAEAAATTTSSSAASSDAAATAAAAGATDVEPNAYTYSALIKAAGEQGQWRLAEAIFGELEAEALAVKEAQRAQERAVAAEVSGGGISPPPAARENNSTSSSAPPARLRGSLDVWRRDSIDGRSFTLAAELAEEVLDGFAASEEEGAGTPAAAPAPPLSPSSNGSSRSTLSPSSSAAALSRFSWAAAAPASAAAAAADASNPWGGGGDDETDALSSPLTAAATAAWSLPAVDATAASTTTNSSNANRTPSLLNEVVCGALMAAHERAGRADDAVRVLDRAAALGVAPNAVMFNTALAALGRRGRFDEALALFEAMPFSPPDAVAHETLVAAAGVAGRPKDAEAAFERLLAAGHAPRDYAFCGLIAAHSAAGDLKSALAVRERYAAAAAEAAAKAWRQASGVGVEGGLLSGVRSALSFSKQQQQRPASSSPAFAAVAGAAAGAAASAAALATPAKPSVHVYNALLAACERARAWDDAVQVAEAMRRDGVAPDADTARLLQAVGRGGVGAVEDAQLAAAALSPALAAAGGLLMRTGMF